MPSDEPDLECVGARFLVDVGYHQDRFSFDGIDFSCTLSRARLEDPNMDIFRSSWGLWH